MSQELLSAVCLAAVIEGLLLFVAPGGWRRAVEQMHAFSDDRLRFTGGIVIGVALVGLWMVRH